MNYIFVIETEETRHTWKANQSCKNEDSIIDTVLMLCEKYGVPNDFEVLEDSSSEMLAAEIASFYELGSVEDEREYDWLHAYFTEAD